MPNRLVAENIFVSINRRPLLEGCVLTCQTGEITGLLGRNGEGKSTLLKTIFGTLQADDSTIHINGQLTTRLYTRCGIINYLPQHNFLPNFRLSKICSDFNIDSDELTTFFPELKQHWNDRTSTLSTGLVRIISVAVILLQKTMFSLLDEPFTFIAPIFIDRLKHLLVAKSHEKGIVVTDHMYKPILECSDTIFSMTGRKTIKINSNTDLITYGYLRNL